MKRKFLIIFAVAAVGLTAVFFAAKSCFDGDDLIAEEKFQNVPTGTGIRPVVLPGKKPVATKREKPQTDNFYVFDLNTNIFVGNSPETLDIIDVNGSQSAISPDGKNIACIFQKPAPSCVYVYNIKEKQGRILKFPVDLPVSNPVFAPDGKFLAAVMTTPSSSRIAVYDLEKDTFKTVYKDMSYYFSPAFSPEGSLLTFHDMQKVYIYGFNGFSLKLLKTVDCGNFCMDNATGIAENCKFQTLEDTVKILYTYNCYLDTVITSTVLACYDIKTEKIKNISGNGKFCTDFQASLNSNVYFLLQNSSDSTAESFLYMTELSAGKPVRVSERSFEPPCSFSVSF